MESLLVAVMEFRMSCQLVQYEPESTSHESKFSKFCVRNEEGHLVRSVSIMNSLKEPTKSNQERASFRFHLDMSSGQLQISLLSQRNIIMYKSF